MKSGRTFLLLVLISSLLLAACGGGDGSDPPEPTEDPSLQAGPGDDAANATQGGAAPDQALPTATPTGPRELNTDEIAELKPNELGWIPVLEYHHIEPNPEQFVRTAEQFQADLQLLYDNDFYVVNLHDYLDNTMEIPAGKHPVMLTFDDGPATQFRLTPLDNGQLAIDLTTAIGIMETFFQQHPDFGRGGHFSLLPDRTFAWSNTRPEDSDQYQYASQKLEWLLANGYEIGNHTMDHADLSDPNTDVEYQLGAAHEMILQQAPDADIRVVTLPYGGYPNGGDDSVFRSFTYEGKQYSYDAALLVGANPAFSPVSTEYDPYAIPRIQAFDEELDKWFTFFEENPGILYTSDGNPQTVTVPDELHWGIVDTLDETKLDGKQLIRY